MYEAHERAGIFGWYLLGPLLGPALGMSASISSVTVFSNNRQVLSLEVL